MNFSTLFVDLDDTLYPNDNGLWGAIRERMAQFMENRLGFSPEEIPEIRRTYFETYGTTLKGLQINYQVDADEYLSYVHDLPLEKYIAPDEKIRPLLTSLPQRKWIFTNADINHARRVLSILDIDDCFAGIIDIHALRFFCKPDLQAYHNALSVAGENNPIHCVMFDDAPRNLVPAKQLGMTTIQVGTHPRSASADFSITSLHELPFTMPELWQKALSQVSAEK
jgi:pyrimidine 5'-nucleotidase